MDVNLYFKSIIDQDLAPVVICSLNHDVIYMNKAAIDRYNLNLTGKSIFNCHNDKSRHLIESAVSWFEKSEKNNIVHETYNPKENKDTYLVALREEGRLIGYYEKHEYRNADDTPFYDFKSEATDECEKNETDDSNYQLFLRQKDMLEQFLSSGAITKKQFDKSFNDMKEKMGY